MRARFRLRDFCFAIMLTVILTGCGWGEEHDDVSLRNSFKETIGFDQPASVTHVRSYYYWVRDSYSRWLCFDCDDATIKTIENLPRDTVTYWSYADIGPGNRPNGNPNAPDWWKQGPSDIKGFTIDRSKPNARSELIHISIDRENHRVYAERDVLNY
jgi:hypothetical protein